MLSLVHIPSAKYDMQMERISSELLVGQGSYDTDMIIMLEDQLTGEQEGHGE